MTSGATPVFAWASFLTFLTTVLFIWTPHAELQWGPFALAAAATWTIGAVVRFRQHGHVPASLGPRSGAGLLLAAGLAVTGNALVFGWWLALVGAVLVVLALGVFAREVR